MDALKRQIMDLVTGSETRLSPQAIENTLRMQGKANRKQIRQAIQSLLTESTLAYTYVYGASYLEPSFQRPVRISSSIVVKPHNLHYTACADDVVIDLLSGISFGSGAHPTTRLSVQGIEYALKEKQLLKNFSGSSVLDIGTGSGILAIAALKLGIETGIGVDTDACARAEAIANTALNGYSEKIAITSNTEGIETDFSLITANLRLPDLLTLCPLIARRTRDDGLLVLSGIRPHETAWIIERYVRDGFLHLERREEKQWACLVFQKRQK